MERSGPGNPVGMVAIYEGAGTGPDLRAVKEAVEQLRLDRQTFFQRAAEAADRRFEVGAQRRLGEGRNLPGQLQCPLKATAALGHLVDQPDPFGFGSSDHPPRDDQVKRAGHTDHPGQALGAAVTESDVPAPASHPERCVLIGYPDVGEAGPFEPARVRGAVDRGDHRLVDRNPSGWSDVPFGRNRPGMQVATVEERLGLRIRIEHRNHRLEVGPGAESFGSGSGDDQDIRLVIVAKPAHEVEEGPRFEPTDRVAGPWPVDRDQADPGGGFLVEDGFGFVAGHEVLVAGQGLFTAGGGDYHARRVGCAFRKGHSGLWQGDSGLRNGGAGVRGIGARRNDSGR